MRLLEGQTLMIGQIGLVDFTFLSTNLDEVGYKYQSTLLMSKN